MSTVFQPNGDARVGSEPDQLPDELIGLNGIGSTQNLSWRLVAAQESVRREMADYTSMGMSSPSCWRCRCRWGYARSP